MVQVDSRATSRSVWDGAEECCCTSSFGRIETSSDRMKMRDLDGNRERNNSTAS